MECNGQLVFKSYGNKKMGCFVPTVIILLSFVTLKKTVIVPTPTSKHQGAETPPKKFIGCVFTWHRHFKNVITASLMLIMSCGRGQDKSYDMCTVTGPLKMLSMSVMHTVPI